MCSPEEVAYIPRFIQPVLTESMHDNALVIVEGARAVGKTSLVAALHKEGALNSWVSLSHSEVRSAAESDIDAWLRSLPQPFAIDEAQLVAELPLALKRLLDETEDQLSGLLTGSAEIGRKGLGGSDPLARRAQRYRLEPLTEAELIGDGITPWSAADMLLNGTPRAAVNSASDGWWKDALWHGGMPSTRLTSKARRNSSGHIRSGVDAVLTEEVLPDERFDLNLARRVLDYTLRKPAEELKAQTIARSADLDSRTVNRYLDVLERRFLIHELNNHYRSAKTSARVTAKAYPADTSLSAEWLPGTSYDQLSDEARGHLFEAFVVQQLRAHLAWSLHARNLYHWRDTRSGRAHEVDVVIESEDGSLAAIEVKSANRARSHDFTGIKHMKAKYGERLTRGFVITPNGRPTAFGENLWAIPIDALRDQDLWEEAPSSPAHPQRTPSRGNMRNEAIDATKDNQRKDSMSQPAQDDRSPSETVVDTKIFVSYAHKDHEGVYGGDLVRFARDVVETLDAVYEWTADLKIDEDFLKWGTGVEEKIEKELAESALFLPFITPSYLKSSWCRQEFTRFSEAADRVEAGNQKKETSLILPLLWVTPKAVREQNTSDPVVARVLATKYLDANVPRVSDRNSQEYRQQVDKVAQSLAAVLDERVNDSHQVEEVAASSNADERDLIEVLSSIEDLQVRFESDLRDFGETFKTFGREFQQVSMNQQPGSGTSAKEMLNWAEQARRRLETPSRELEDASALVKNDWEALTSNLSAIIGIGASTGQEIPPEEVAALAEGLEEATSGLQDADLAQMEMIANGLPRMSRRLSPIAKALQAALETIRTISVSSDGWLNSLYRAAGQI